MYLDDVSSESCAELNKGLCVVLGHYCYSLQHPLTMSMGLSSKGSVGRPDGWITSCCLTRPLSENTQVEARCVLPELFLPGFLCGERFPHSLEGC